MSPTYLFSTITTTVLLLSVLTTTLARDTTLVYDTNSNPLEPNKNYYLVPTNNGGGIKAVPVGPKICPYTFYISQEENNLNLGYPISFIHSSRISPTISVSTNVQIKFPMFPPSYVLCFKNFPRVWGAIEKNINYNATYVVEVNGVEGVFPWFSIEDHEDGNYMLMYCVTEGACGAVNFVNDENGKPILGLSFKSDMSFVFEPYTPKKVKSSSRKQAMM